MIKFKLPAYCGLFVVVLLSLFSACTAPKATMGSHAGKKIYRQLESSHTFDAHYYGLYVVDAETGKEIYKHNAHNYFTPASLTKLFTYYLGKQVLPEKMPFVDYIIDRDTAILWPYGDPEFLNPQLKNPFPLIDSLKSLAPILYLSNAQFKDEKFGAGWAWDDYIYSFQPEKSFFPVYGNIVSFTLLDAEFHIVDVHPHHFKSWLSYRPSIGGTGFHVERAPFANAFDYNLGPDALTGKKISLPTSSDKYSLSRLLNETLSNTIEIKNIPAEKYAHKATIYGIETDSLYHIMLDKSDNHIAEQLLLAISYKLSDTLKTEIATLYATQKTFSFLPDAFHYIDGSGLSRYNQNTPANVVALLRTLYSTDFEQCISHLPKGSISSEEDMEFPLSLSGPMNDKKVNLWMKTGTMEHVYNFGGYLKTKSGKFVCFAWMNNHFTVPRAQLEAKMMETLQVLYESY